MSLQSQTFKGIIWNFGETFSNQVISFIISIYMARLLSPSDYGMIGMTTIFTSISSAIMQGGFSEALIRKTDRTVADLSTAFYFNVLVSFVLYATLWGVSPFIAQFYEVPALEKLIKILSLVLIVNAFCLVQQTLLTINMNFKLQAQISITSTLAAGSIGLYMAYNGWGVWALAYSYVINISIRTSLLWLFSRWKPVCAFSIRSFKELFSFGSKLTASSILEAIGNNISPIIIGKFFSSSGLGFYTRAGGYAALPAYTLSGIIAKVTYPMLCRIQDDNAHLSQAYRKLLRLSAFVIFPVMTGLATLSFPLIKIMITEKWLPCVPYLQIMCFALILYPIHALNLNLLRVKGRSDLFLWLEVIKKAIGLLILLASAPFGILAMCAGGTIHSFLCWIINSYYSGKLIHVSFYIQLKDFLPAIGYTFLMASCILVFKSLVMNEYIQLAGGALIGLAVYFSSAYLTKSQDLYFLLQLLCKRKDE